MRRCQGGSKWSGVWTEMIIGWTSALLLQPNPQNLNQPSGLLHEYCNSHQHSDSYRNSTVTLTPTNTFAPTPVPPMSVIINEVAWAGTAASSSDDQWIELYNPGAQPVNLMGWHLISSDNSPDILLTGTIPASGYYLLKIREAAIISTRGTPGPAGNDYAADQLYAGNCLQPVRRCACTRPPATWWILPTSTAAAGMAGREAPPTTAWSGAWASPTDCSRGSPTRACCRNGLDANGNPINGTPKRANWANSCHAYPYFHTYRQPHAHPRRFTDHHAHAHPHPGFCDPERSAAACAHRPERRRRGGRR